MGRTKTKDITNAMTARLIANKSMIGPRVVEDPYEFTCGHNQSGKTGEDPGATQASKEKSGGNGEKSGKTGHCLYMFPAVHRPLGLGQDMTTKFQPPPRVQDKCPSM